MLDFLYGTSWFFKLCVFGVVILLIVSASSGSGNKNKATKPPSSGNINSVDESGKK